MIDGTTAANNTFSNLDALNGGAGNDVLNLNNTSAAAADATTLSVATISNIETINIQSVAGITKTSNTYTAGTTEVDFSSISGLTEINATKSTAALIKAAATTDVNVSGASDLISVIGGKNISVTDATAAKAITVGNGAAAGDAAGTITITDTNNSGANAISVEGGTDVTVTATAAAVMTAGITVGSAANGTATGNVAITQNLTSDGATINHSAVAIAAVGGKTISITQNLTNTADIQTDAGALTGAAITATADNATTDVTITQNATNTIFTKAAVALVKASQTVTFKDLAATKTVTVNGLVFTAEKDMTAAEVAAAFADLTATDTQSEGGITTNGIYTDANATGGVAGWTSGAANGATVTFTGAADNTATFAVASSDTASVPTKVYTAGTAFAAAIPSTNSVVMGSVVVDDNATKSITTITVDGATSVTLGGAAASGKDLNALTTLSLANVTGATALNTTATSLNMTVNDVATAANAAVAMNLDITAATIADLTLTSTGDASNLTLTAAAVKNLTVNAGAALTISAVSATNVLETVTVNGTAAVALGTIVDSTNLKSFNASANTGGVTATIDASTAASHADLTTFTFSEGNDVVTLDNAAINKNINLGAGDDSITLAAGVTAITKVIDGGTGTNTIAMTALQAETATASDTFEAKIDNLQILSIGATLAATTVDLANMDDISYVVTAGTGAAVNTNTLTLNNMANNGTVVLTTVNGATAGTVVNVKNADTNTADDTLNIHLDSAGNLTGGIFNVANVEIINVSSTDTEVAATPTKNANTLTLTADKAETVNVSGGNDLVLTLTGSTAVTLVDGSTMTGNLTATTAATIKGGSGNDNLTATSNNDVLMGGAGNDTLIVTSGNLVQLEGGAGKDIYQIDTSSNQNAYATINGTDAELSGDVIQFTSQALAGFSNAKIVLGSTAVFQDYVNEAAKGTTDNAGTVSYFVWESNTYLVQDNNDATTFTNSDDAIVKIAGVVDFTFNSTTNVLEIA